MYYVLLIKYHIKSAVFSRLLMHMKKKNNETKIYIYLKVSI